MGSAVEDAGAFAAHADRVRALPLALLRKQLLAKGALWGMKQAEAEDGTQAAVMRLVTNGPPPWDHVKDPKAWSFLLKNLKGYRNNKARREERRETVVSSDLVDEVPPSSARRPDASLIEEESAATKRAELLRRLSDNPLAVRVVELCIEKGQLKPAELADEMGEDVKRIYKVHRRIYNELTEMNAIAVQARTEEDRPA